MRQLIKGSERKVSLWAGGSSSQICIWPQDAQYAERNFLYRIIIQRCRSITSSTQQSCEK